MSPPGTGAGQHRRAPEIVGFFVPEILQRAWQAAPAAHGRGLWRPSYNRNPAEQTDLLAQRLRTKTTCFRSADWLQDFSVPPTSAGSRASVPKLRRSMRSRPISKNLSDADLKARTARIPRAHRQRRDASTTCSSKPSPPSAKRAKRTLGQRHFDVQLIGGMVLHQGDIAEMKTGEGKTLVATLPVYLNALAGKGVHVVTVNDYLAKRDSGVDGAGLYVPRPHRRRHRPRHERRAAQGRLRLRRHLRHQQRARLRLSPRQHEDAQGRDGPARPLLRHRRRSRTRS